MNSIRAARAAAERAGPADRVRLAEPVALEEAAPWAAPAPWVAAATRARGGAVALEPTEEGDCGCRVRGQRAPWPTALLAVAATLGLVLRRRKLGARALAA